MDLRVASDWVKGEKHLALSKLETACQAQDLDAIEASTARLIHLNQLVDALRREAPEEGKLRPRVWFLYAAIASAVVVLLLSIHPTAGLIAMEASSRGVRLAFGQDVKLKGEELEFVGYDITEVSGAAKVVDAQNGAVLPLNAANERLGLEPFAAIAAINVPKDDELSLELISPEQMRLSLHGYGSSIDVSLNGSAVRLLDNIGQPIETGALKANRNVRFQGASALDVILKRSPSGESVPIIQFAGQMDLVAFDKRAPLNGLLTGRSNLLQSATIAFLDFGDEKSLPFGGQALSIIKANGAFELSAKGTAFNAVFNGDAENVRRSQVTLTPSFLHWFWKNTTITFTVGALISVLGFLLAGRTRFNEFIKKG